MKGKYIQVYVTKREAQMVQAIRQLKFGKAVVHKNDGKPVRIEVVESVMLKDDGNGVTLEKEG